MKLARPVGGDTFTIVGQSPLEGPAANQLHTYTDVRISVQPGDVLGFAIRASGECLDNAAVGYGEHVASGDRAPGDSFSYSPFSNVQLDVAASLEPDADNDGFGDETQDQCPTDASKQGDCAPPDTQITNRPKDKTKKKQATFEFSSTEPGSTFECSLDGAAFAPCTSGQSFKVKKGKHSFSVRATDAAGNVDASAASDNWKVKKRGK